MEATKPSEKVFALVEGTQGERFLLVLTSSLTLRRMNDQCPDHTSREIKEDKLLTRMTDGEKEDGDMQCCMGAVYLLVASHGLMHVISLQHLITHG